jgi:hypothetical protein
MKGKLCRVDQTCHFVLAQHLRQVQNLLRIRVSATLQPRFNTCT